MPHFIVVEDDHLQEGPLAEILESAFDSATVTTLCTESAFREHMRELCANVPDLVVLDVMLRWSDPRPGLPAPPDDVLSDGYYRAGLRCAEMMLGEPRLRGVPVVLYTILEVSDLNRDGRTLPANATYVGKSSDMEVLVRHIRSRLRRRATEPHRSTSR